MRIGICSWWFNRGQAVVGRQLRSALDSLGHETFVLARPSRDVSVRPSFIDRTGADELMVTAQIFDHSARVRSFEILAGVHRDLSQAA